MSVHQQVPEIAQALAEQQVVLYFGSVGTGRTTLALDLVQHLSQVGVATVLADAARVSSISELNAPVERLLGADAGRLATAKVPGLLRARIIVDNCHAIYDAPWLAEFQDSWRAFLTAPAAEGRVSALFLGRPVFRNALGGRGSPLMNVAKVMHARPLDASRVADACAVEEKLAALIVEKTGGHPGLVRWLASACENHSDFGAAYKSFQDESFEYVTALVDDHGIEARLVLRELLEYGSVPADALLGHHFADPTEGIDVLDDLTSSGLTCTDHESYSLGARVLRDNRSLRSFIRAAGTDADIPVDAPGEHANAAQMLYTIENDLRSKIVAWLSKLDRSWWPRRVPDDSLAAERLWLGERGARFAPATPLHPIMYLSLGELLMIPEYADNWPRAFEPRWRVELATFHGLRADLVAVRNKVAHNRPVSPEEVELVRTAAARLRLRSH